MILFETPRYLQAAEDKEKEKILKARVLEPIEQAPAWSRRTQTVERSPRPALVRPEIGQSRSEEGGPPT